MQFRRVLVCATTLAAMASPTVAQEVDYQPVFESVFSHMALTYVCRNDLGGLAHYQAARTIAVGTIALLMKRSDAVLAVDEMDQKFRNDPRTADPKVPRGACIELVNDSLHNIDVQKAKAGL